MLLAVFGVEMFMRNIPSPIALSTSLAQLFLWTRSVVLKILFEKFHIILVLRNQLVIILIAPSCSQSSMRNILSEWKSQEMPSYGLPFQKQNYSRIAPLKVKVVSYCAILIKSCWGSCTFHTCFSIKEVHSSPWQYLLKSSKNVGVAAAMGREGR